MITYQLANLQFEKTKTPTQTTHLKEDCFFFVAIVTFDKLYAIKNDYSFKLYDDDDDDNDCYSFYLYEWTCNDDDFYRIRYYFFRKEIKAHTRFIQKNKTNEWMKDSSSDCFRKERWFEYLNARRPAFRFFSRNFFFFFLSFFYQLFFPAITTNDDDDDDERQILFRNRNRNWNIKLIWLEAKKKIQSFHHPKYLI